jgi:small-conductance mechanosensitive channel
MSRAFEGTVHLEESSMHDAFTSLGLLALTAIAVFITRRRTLWIRMAVEAGLLLTIGLNLVLQGTSPLPHFEKVPIGLSDAWFRALVIVWWLIAARLTVNGIVLVRGQNAKSREARLFSDLASFVIYITTVLIILNSVLDLDVRGLLVTSGAIAIIVGLALQNTLADVFCGVAISLEQPFHVGDRVSVGDNLEGVIVQMNWRSVRIHTDEDDLATVPNSLVAKGQIINRSVPTRRRAATVEIVAPADAVSGKILDLIGQATLLCPNILPMPAPSITILRSGLRSSTYAANFFVADASLLSAARSSLLRNIHRLFQHAGIGRSAPMSPAELVASLPLFEALSREEIESLAPALVGQAVAPGDTIFEQGAASSSIYLVEAGVMELSRCTGQADNRLLGRIGPGECIGELGFFTGSPRAFTVKSLTHGRVLELPRSNLTNLLQSNADLNAEMERCVRKWLAQLDREDVAKIAHMADRPADILARIKAFFQV